MTAFGLITALTLISIFTCVTKASRNDPFSAEEVKVIEQFLSEVLICSNIPGMSLGVVRGDATYTKGEGFANMDSGEAVNPSTIFNLGSTAKAFVPYVLAEIMNSPANQAGRLRWNMTLKELLRSELELDVSAPWADLQLKEALIYRASGSPTGQDADSTASSNTANDLSTMTGLPENVDREELIRRMAWFMPDSPEFRFSAHFSNLMYTVAAHLAEKVSGKTWKDLVKAQVLDKRDMSVSQFAPDGLLSDSNVALPYKFSPEIDFFKVQNISLFDLHPFEPVGSLMASADDIAKWLRHLLHNLYMKGNDSGINMMIGDAFHNAVSSPASTSRHQPEGFGHNYSESLLGHGMGWQVSNYRGRRRYQYSGRLYAYTSHIWLFPESRTAVFVASSGHEGPEVTSDGEDLSYGASLAIDSILYMVSDVIHREEPWVDYEQICLLTGNEDDYDDNYDDYDEKMYKDATPPVEYALPSEAYHGSYGNGLIGNVQIETDAGGILTLTLGRNLEGELTPIDTPESDMGRSADVNTNRLKLKVTGWLGETDEWVLGKYVEFSGYDLSGKFNVLRLYLTIKLFYDFERDKQFETMLILAEQGAELKKREEEEKRIKEENDRREQEEIRRAKEEADRQEREEAMRRARQEEDRLVREEAMKRMQEEADRRDREKAMRRMQEEADRRDREDAMRRMQEEADRQVREEEMIRAQEEVDRREAMRRTQEEAERREREEEQEEEKRREMMEAARREKLEQERITEEAPEVPEYSSSRTVAVTFEGSGNSEVQTNDPSVVSGAPVGRTDSYIDPEKHDEYFVASEAPVGRTDSYINPDRHADYNNHESFVASEAPVGVTEDYMNPNSHSAEELSSDHKNHRPYVVNGKENNSGLNVEELPPEKVDGNGGPQSNSDGNSACLHSLPSLVSLIAVSSLTLLISLVSRL